MTFTDLIQHFGSQTAAAKALSITKGAIHQWKADGIPLPRQYQIQVVTNGALKAANTSTSNEVA